MQRSFGIVGGLILSLAAFNAQAVPVTVNPVHTAGNGSATWPFYNYSVPSLELSAFPTSGWGNTSSEGYTATAIQRDGFSELHGVSYTSSPVGDIDLMPLAGNTDGQHIQFDFTPTPQHAIDTIRLEGDDPLGIPAVPVPTVAWLFGPGMLGLVAVARRHPL